MRSLPSMLLADKTQTTAQSLRFLVPAMFLMGGLILFGRGINATDLQQWLKWAGPWGPIAFVIVGVFSMSLLVPKTVVSITAGALFGTPLGSLLMLVTAVAAAWLNYAIGRWWLFDSIDRRLRETGQPPHSDWGRVVRDLAANAGFRFHLLVRLAPIPTTLISYSMGASGGKLRPFLCAAALAVLPQMLWVHSGTTATMLYDPNRSVLQWTTLVVSVSAAVVVSIVIPRQALQRIAALKEAEV